MSDIIKFTREKEFVLVNEIGSGACGKTVLLYDETIRENFVCKKFSPMAGTNKEELFNKFIQEIKILHLAYHPNIVRIFNYYIYSKSQAGFIVMEHVNGTTFEDYLNNYPENIDNIFRQCLRGFEYLGELNILHRDIRPGNIMITNPGVVKIIDFGFGKPAVQSADFEKSVTLNWWGSAPAEFSEQKYDFATEVYFVGMLFQKMISQNKIKHFSYGNILKKMCQHSPSERFKNFKEIKIDSIAVGSQNNIFSEDDKRVFRNFSSELIRIVSSIEKKAKYVTDVSTLESGLDDIYTSVMLNDFIPKSSNLISVFFSGGYKYWPKQIMEVEILKDFLNLFKSASGEKKNIIVRNLCSVLDGVPRHEDAPPSNDDIPF